MEDGMTKQPLDLAGTIADLKEQIEERQP